MARILRGEIRWAASLWSNSPWCSKASMKSSVTEP